MPPAGGEFSVGASQLLADRDAVQQRQPGHQLRMVQGQPQRHLTAPIVPGQGESIVTQSLHHGHQVAGRRTFAVRGVVGARRRTSAAAVAAQVSTDHGETTPDQHWRHSMPGRGGPRVPVEQQHRRPIASATDEHRGGTRVDPVSGEAVEHPVSMTHPDCAVLGCDAGIREPVSAAGAGPRIAAVSPQRR